MDCPFCAEQIQDAAILCRFCGARKQGQTWQAPQPVLAAPPAKPVGQFTMHFAALCFLLSAVYELKAIQDAVPLFGATRSGPVAITYHVLYVAVFAAMGIGLWGAWRWGFWVTLGGTAFYTLDKAIYLLDEASMSAQAAQLSAKYSGLISKSMLMESARLSTLTALVCWWGFAAFVIFRRAYFFSPAAPLLPSPTGGEKPTGEPTPDA